MACILRAIITNIIIIKITIDRGGKMQTKTPVMAAAITLILAIVACTLPNAQNKINPQSDMALTITAQALVIQNSTNQGTINNPVIQTPLSMKTPDVSFASTPIAPMVSVSSPTNCRTGPSTDYDLLYTLNVGQTVNVVGKYSSGNYWIINNPNGGGNCWLWGQYATIIGNTANLPEMVPPPAPPTAVPADTAKPTAVPTLNKHLIQPVKPLLPFLLATATPTSKYKLVQPYKPIQPVKPLLPIKP
jgi:Bacterial SH3 domain